MRAYLHLPHGILCFGTSSILSLALNSCIILNLCIIRCSECCVLWLHVLNFEGMLYSCAICILEYWTYGIKICEKSVYMQEVFQTNTGIHTHTHVCVFKWQSCENFTCSHPMDDQWIILMYNSSFLCQEWDIKGFDCWNSDYTTNVVFFQLTECTEQN